MAQDVDVSGRQDAGKAFPHIEVFLKLARTSQSDFTVAYYVRRDSQPAGDANAVLYDGGQMIPLPIAPDGRVGRLPTLDEIRSHAMVSFTTADNARLNVRIGLAPITPPAPIMGAAPLERAIRQANAAIHHLAGPFGVVVPKLKSALFDGAEGGVAILADGTTTPLPTKKDSPFFDPSKMHNVVSLTFTKPAGHIDIQ